ncbi:MAG TPA: hypothetical protein VMJ32_16745 [Pirellulales bacterium]|nr:hypothetical protein [Pirellulales bacterium]
MATRRKYTSLRGRFAWTLASAAAIGLVSLVSIVLYRSRKPAEHEEPGLLATAAPQPDAEQAISSPAPSAKFDAVQAVATDGSNDNRHGDKSPYSVQMASGEFVEQTPGSIPAGNFHSPRYGYSVTLNGTNWTRWDDLAAVVPEAEWGALLNNYGRFLVMPVVLADPAASPTEIDRALLAQFGFEYPSQRPTELTNFQRQGAEGHLFRLTRQVSGRENVYRIWILRRDRYAYLVAAWVDRTAAFNAKSANADADEIPGRSAGDAKFNAEIEAQLDDVLSRFKFDDLAATAGEPNTLNERRGLHHASHLQPQPAAVEN